MEQNKITHTLADWQRIYRAKEELLEERGFQRVTHREFYRDVFPEGYLQAEEKDNKGNMHIQLIPPKLTAEEITQGKHQKRSKRYLVGDDFEHIDKVIGADFALVAPLSYWGKRRLKENAHQLFAIAVDIDYVGLEQLKNQLKQFARGVQLCPTYIVNSGRGLHYYYLLDEPIDMYHYREKILSDLKKNLIRRLWNDTSSLRPDAPDITGVYQAFRAVGSRSKLGKDYTVHAWKLCDRRYTLQEIKDACPKCTVDLSALWAKPQLYPDTQYTLDEVKELFPEWYQRRIVEGLPPETRQKQWTTHEGLYAWWKEKMLEEVRMGGRYYSVMALCAFGIKSGIDEARIRSDAYSFLEHLESLTEDETNHFTVQDIEDALDALQDTTALRLHTRAWIAEKSKVPIPPQKRNGRPRKAHVKYMNGIKQLRKELGENVSGGRPDKSDIIYQWRLAHPDGTQAQCIRDTGISKPTVRKWWQSGKERNEN